MQRCRVGVCGRNDYTFYEPDYQAIQIARIETLKMMSQTDVAVYKRVREINPEMEFIVRLYDDRIRDGNRVSPQQFVERMAPIIQRLRPWVVKFEVHNEPNHVDGKEGWGPSDDMARDFNQWYLEVLRRLREVAPWAEFGFPGLAVGDYPHRDRAWLQICRPAIEASDWLGVHCYWQFGNMRSRDWGFRFQIYHDMYPDKPIEITEFGDSTNADYPGTKSPEQIAAEYKEYYTLLQKYAYLRSASAFILSSQDRQWEPFAWRLENGTLLPVVYAVADVPRPERVRHEAAWQVEWVDAQVPAQIPLGIGTAVTITVRNTGTETWQNTGDKAVRLGYKWYTQRGEKALPDAMIFTALPRPVAPGETVTLQNARVIPPPWPGTYILEWDLITGEDTWFAQEGNEPYRTTVNVVLTPESKRRFPETGRVVEQPFLSFYYRYGLAITGYPITDVVVENGKRCQYWQRVAMEEYEPGKVRLKLIGSEVLALRARAQELMEWLQRSTALPVPDVTHVVYTLPRDASAMIKRSLTEIRYIVFDHTAIEWRIDLNRLAEAIRRRMPGVPYHYYIDQDGTIYQTEPLDEVVIDRVDHIYGIRIGVAGNFSVGIPNEAQLAAAAHLTAWLLRRFNLPIEAVKGTSEFKDVVVTESPGKNWLEGPRWKDMLIERVQQWLERVAPPEKELPTGEITATLDELQRQLTIHQEMRKALWAELQAQKEANQSLTEQLRRAHQQVGELQAAIDRLRALLRSLNGRARPRLPKPNIVDIVEQLPKHPEKTYPTRELEEITHIAIHHSAAPANVPPEQVARYHVERKGWPGIGYHFYIMPDGTIYQTNYLTTMSNHVFMNNRYSVGICLAGNFSENLPTPAQLNSAATLTAWLMEQLNIPIENVWGHKEYPEQNTSCPGDQWVDGFKWREMFFVRLKAALRGELDRLVEKPIYHYMLFWQTQEAWAREDWLNSINYVARYRPTMGFSHDDAKLAQRVTIVGGPLGVSEEVERLLRQAGCTVRRVAGANEAETKALLDKLAEEGDPFLS